MLCRNSCGRKAQPGKRHCLRCQERAQFRDFDRGRYAGPKVKLTKKQRKRRRVQFRQAPAPMRSQVTR